MPKLMELYLQASLTVGELVAALLLDGDPQGYDCALVLIRQCTQWMASHFYSYAQPRGAAYEKLGSAAMPASIKEAAVNKVRSGEKGTLEDALESMGYNRKLAASIFKDCCRLANSLSTTLYLLDPVLPKGPRKRPHVSQHH